MAENLDNPENKENNKKTILVISGGGIKGICIIGALHGLQEKKILDHITTYAGTSIGAFISVLLILNYNPEELIQIVLDLDMRKLLRKEDKYCNLFCDYGIDDGVKFTNILNMLFEFKNINKNITMKELFTKSNKNLYITTTCLNTKEIVYINHENFPDLEVITAVRMSCSVPLYFCPVLYNNYYYVDGGCIDNYPINIFNDHLDQVIGIYVRDNMQCIEEINSIQSFLLTMLKTVYIGVHHKNYKGYEKFTYLINVSGINILNVNMTEEEKLKMFDLGRQTINNYFIN
jgi:predicted acylesterase/phospholipase RssA